MEKHTEHQPQNRQERTPESIRNNFEQKRIKSDESFAILYSSYKEDMRLAEKLKNKFETKTEQDELGFFGEALVLSCIEEGALGVNITARGTSSYDDLIHGADVIIESKGRQQRDPIISSIDVTVSQKAPSSDRTKIELQEKPLEVGLEKKLARVRKHIDYIANYPREKAVEMSAWLQSGGFSQTRNKDNDHKFEEAEKLMLLKYYKNPATSEDPNKPHFVLAGPQVVLGIDRSFVNRAISGNRKEKAIQDINTLIQVEVPLAVGILTQYVEALSKNGKESNLFFDMTHAACRSWELTFETEQNQLRIQKAINLCINDPDLKNQFMYYQKTLTESFSIKE